MEEKRPAPPRVLPEGSVGGERCERGSAPSLTLSRVELGSWSGAPSRCKGPELAGWWCMPGEAVDLFGDSTEICPVGYICGYYQL